jgi:two-component system, chemotaxis family, chemotaxis protein CheY
MIKRVLVVDDSEATRSMIVSCLEDPDRIEVFEAASGFEALRLLPRHHFDAIVTDINMPDINGLELIGFLKNHPQYRSIPILVVSTEVAEDDVKRALALGSEEYVKKPFAPEVMSSAVERLLAKSSG